MIIQRSYKFRLYPTKNQEARMREILGSCRFVWNHYLAKQEEAYATEVKRLGYYDHAKDLTHLKRQSPFLWLANSRIDILQQSLRDLDRAFCSFHQNKAQFPRYKTKKDRRQTFRKSRWWSIAGARLNIENGLHVRFRGPRIPSGARHGSIVVSMESSGSWWAAVKTEQELLPKAKSGKPLGIDLGLTHLAITSKGKKFDNLKPRKAEQKRMKALQQEFARKQKGSKRRETARIELARLHEKIRHRRMNHLHQTSHRITSENQALIVCEDLAVKNMQRNHCLAGSIADTGWGEFIRQLQYKQEWRGGQFVKIDRFFPSSKTCSNCSFIVDSLPLFVRQWTCPRCKETHDRDVNAARMILKQGLRNSPCVESTDGTAKVRRRGRVTGSAKR